jgi:hypothetical protein
MRFDGKVVIPVQFVLFNLSAILGSAILYNDFKRTTFHQFVTFLYGCGATFAGVFIIAWAPDPSARNQTSQAEEGLLDGGEGLEVGAMGTLGRRQRATLVLPSHVQEGRQILKKQKSSVGMIGLSPARNLLLINTPPQEGMVYPYHGRFDPLDSPTEAERNRYYYGDSAASLSSTPGESGGTGQAGLGLGLGEARQRTLSWFGEDASGRSAGKVRGSLSRKKARNSRPSSSGPESRGGGGSSV